MKRRKIIVLCLIMAVCIAVGVCSAAANARSKLTYQITSIEIWNLLVFSPLLRVCAGMLVGTLVGTGKGFPLGTPMKVVAIAAIGAYICAISIYALDLQIKPVYQAALWCASHADIFAVPGLLLGICGRK